jgi:hypothetical protein
MSSSVAPLSATRSNQHHLDAWPSHMLLEPSQFAGMLADCVDLSQD